MIKALIFDLDGTLIDSHVANVKAYTLAFEEAGLVFDDKKYGGHWGLRFSEMMDQLAPQADETTRKAIKESKSKHYKNHFHLIRLNEGLWAFLHNARPYYKTALVTTAGAKNVENLLNHLGNSSKLFDVVVTGEDVKHAKPDPEGYEIAAQKLKISPDECLVFEDTNIGVQAAEAAGMKYIKVSL